MKYCVMNHMISHMHVITIVAGLEITFSDHVDILWTLSNISGQPQVLTGHVCSRMYIMFLKAFV